MKTSEIPLRLSVAAGRLRCEAAFTLTEVVISATIGLIGFLGLFAFVLQAGKFSSAAEEEALVLSGLEQRTDQLRMLEWDDLTVGLRLRSLVYTARPESTLVPPGSMPGLMPLTVSQEVITLSPCDGVNAQTLVATWTGTSAPTSTTSGGPALSGASAVKAVVTLKWTGRRSNRQETRSLVTVISRGGISKSDRL